MKWQIFESNISEKGNESCPRNVVYYISIQMMEREQAVTQLVEALLYKPEVRGFDSRWYHWKFSLR